MPANPYGDPTHIAAKCSCHLRRPIGFFCKHLSPFQSMGWRNMRLHRNQKTVSGRNTMKAEPTQRSRPGCKGRVWCGDNTHGPLWCSLWFLSTSRWVRWAFLSWPVAVSEASSVFFFEIAIWWFTFSLYIVDTRTHTHKFCTVLSRFAGRSVCPCSPSLVASMTNSACKVRSFGCQTGSPREAHARSGRRLRPQGSLCMWLSSISVFLWHRLGRSIIQLLISQLMFFVVRCQNFPEGVRAELLQWEWVNWPCSMGCGTRQDCCVSDCIRAFGAFYC